MCDIWGNLAIGVAGSIVASLIFLVAGWIKAENSRLSKAKQFVGKYRMLNAATRTPYGGTVTIEPGDRIARGNDTALLNVIAEHASGTEDWTAVVEVLGYSRMASGFFTYRRVHDGGHIRLLLSADEETIEEHGTPHKAAPFTNLLERITSNREQP